jgi:hypothetical protein
VKESADESRPIYTIQPIQHVGKSHGIAAVRLFLVSDEASYVSSMEFAADVRSGIGRYRGARPEGAIGII